MLSISSCSFICCFSHCKDVKKTAWRKIELNKWGRCILKYHPEKSNKMAVVLSLIATIFEKSISWFLVSSSFLLNCWLWNKCCSMLFISIMGVTVKVEIIFPLKGNTEYELSFMITILVIHFLIHIYLSTHEKLIWKSAKRESWIIFIWADGNFLLVLCFSIPFVLDKNLVSLIFWYV